MTKEELLAMLDDQEVRAKIIRICTLEADREGTFESRLRVELEATAQRVAHLVNGVIRQSPPETR